MMNGYINSLLRAALLLLIAMMVIPPQVSSSHKWNFLVTYPEEIP